LAVFKRWGPSDWRAPPPGAPLVGRDAELQTLDDALRDVAQAPLLMRVVGPSGIGKSTLLEAWLGRVRSLPAPPLVLRGRWLEHENVPFKAIDGVIDSLADHLATIGALPSLRPASRMFPVLAGLVPMPTTSDGLPEDPHVLREQALTSLRDLITKLG